jgi:hypothetical protein
MAIDLFVMALGRYWTGDYVTPTMRAMWERGLSYKVVTADGVKDCPPGQPYGGPDAREDRKAALAEAPLFFAQLARASDDPPWDESDDGDIGDWRLDPRSFAALIEQAERELVERPGWFARTVRRQRGPVPDLCAAQIFVPMRLTSLVDFDGTILGSLPNLRAELDRLTPVRDARDAFAMVSEAADHAIQRRLPLIVDS